MTGENITILTARLINMPSGLSLPARLVHCFLDQVIYKKLTRVAKGLTRESRESRHWNYLGTVEMTFLFSFLLLEIL